MNWLKKLEEVGDLFHNYFVGSFQATTDGLEPKKENTVKTTIIVNGVEITDPEQNPN